MECFFSTNMAKFQLKELKRKSKQSQCWVDDDDDGGGGEGEGSKGLAEWVQAETADGLPYYWHIFNGGVVCHKIRFFLENVSKFL